MKASELRIGNWIADLFDQPLKVSFGTFAYLNEADEEQKDRIKPIPLTEEWLLKFGFEIDYSKGSYHHLTFQFNSIEILEIEGIKYEFQQFLGKNIKIKYVHQLQNLYFALTGEELNIK